MGGCERRPKPPETAPPLPDVISSWVPVQPDGSLISVGGFQFSQTERGLVAVVIHTADSQIRYENVTLRCDENVCSCELGDTILLQFRIISRDRIKLSRTPSIQSNNPYTGKDDFAELYKPGMLLGRYER